MNDYEEKQSQSAVLRRETAEPAADRWSNLIELASFLLFSKIVNC